MKNIVKSLLIVVAVAAIAGGATWAYWTGSATLTGSTFSAGSLDLKIDSDSRSDFANFVDTFAAPSGYLDKLYPGATGSQIIDIKNVGTIDGSTTIKFDVVDGTWSRLGDYLNFTVSYDPNDNNNFTVVTSGPLTAWNHNTYQLGQLLAGKIGQVKIDWSVSTAAGNDVQNTSIKIDTTFGINQAVN